MRIGFLITARLKSSRLPIKLLKDLNGYSVIERVIKRAKKVVECDDIVLCTSRMNQDLPLVRIALKENIYYYNGHAEDVLNRLLEAAEFFNLDFALGITADNPLFSIYHANLISDMIRRDSSLDYVYTTGLPVGVNMYALNVKALRTVCRIKQEVDTEIWGALVKRPEIFNIKEVPVDEEYVYGGAARITLDEIDDYRFFKEIHKHFPKGEVINILDAYQVLKNHPEISSLNASVSQKGLDHSTKSRIEEYYKTHYDKIIQIKNEVYREE